MKCEVCDYETEDRWELHTQAVENEKGWRWICCRCLGHKPKSCLREEKVK